MTRTADGSDEFSLLFPPLLSSQPSRTFTRRPSRPSAFVTRTASESSAVRVIHAHRPQSLRGRCGSRSGRAEGGRRGEGRKGGKVDPSDCARWKMPLTTREAVILLSVCLVSNFRIFHHARRKGGGGKDGKGGGGKVDPSDCLLPTPQPSRLGGSFRTLCRAYECMIHVMSV